MPTSNQHPADDLAGDRSTSGNGHDRDRLDSWKEIASYFGRGITTLQRWEKEEGLPVHRLKHDKQGSVFAYRHELDTWWSSRGRAADDESSQEVITIHVRRRTLAIALGLVVCSAAIVLGARSYLNRPVPQNFCRHPATLGRDRITGLAEFRGSLYTIVHRPSSSGGGGAWAVHRIQDPANQPSQVTVVHRGDAHVERLTATSKGLYTVLHDSKRHSWSAYRSTDGLDLTGFPAAERVYEGDARVEALLPFGSGIVTALSGSPKEDPCGIYYSESGPSLVVTGHSYGAQLYTGRFGPDYMTTFRGGLMTSFFDKKTGESGGVFYSQTGKSPGVVQEGTVMVASPLRTGAHVEMMLETAPGMMTAFYNRNSNRSWGIYLSPDGHHLNSTGKTRRAYHGNLRPDALLAYGDGVLAAFYDPATGKPAGVYYSPDGLNLAGGEKTVRLYAGPLRVSAMARYGDGFVAAFFDPATGDGRGMQVSRSIEQDSLQKH